MPDQIEEHDLHSLLDADQRVELMLLVTKSAQRLRESLDAVFTLISDEEKAEIEGKDEETSYLTEFKRLAKLTLNSKGDKKTVNASQLVPDESSQVPGASAPGKAKPDESKAEKHAPVDAEELKRDALNAFDTWYEAVTLRVAEVLHRHEETTPTSKWNPLPSYHKHSKDDGDIKPEVDRTAASADVPDRPLNPDKDKHYLLRYPPLESPLKSLHPSAKALVTNSLLLLVLSLKHYSAFSRLLLINITLSLGLSLEVLSVQEHHLAQTLINAAMDAEGTEAVVDKAAQKSVWSRRWKIGLAGVAGAAVIGVTGGLAAPLVAAGIGTLMGGLGLAGTAAAGYLGAVAGSSAIVGAMFGAYGGKMSGEMMQRFTSEIKDFAFVPISSNSKSGLLHLPKKKKIIENAKDRRLRVTVGITGWLTDISDVTEPWKILSGEDAEVYALRWEVDALTALGSALVNFIKNYALGYVKKAIIKRTVLATLYSALWPLALMKVARVVDNPFTIASTRAERTGIVLADAIASRVQGERPVTLIGFSLGARVIYFALRELARRKDRGECFGLVEDVVLMGAPAPADETRWRELRAVVAGRLVNVYSGDDYILAFLYRASAVQYGVAGLQPITGVRGVENVDVSDIVDGHLRYRYLTGLILGQRVGIGGIATEEVTKEEAQLKAKVEAANATN